MKKVSFALLLMLTGCGLLNAGAQELSKEDCILQLMVLGELIASGPLIEGETVAERESTQALIRLLPYLQCTERFGYD